MAQNMYDIVGCRENLSVLVFSHSDTFLIRLEGYTEVHLDLSENLLNFQKLVKAAQKVLLADKKSSRKNINLNRKVFGEV